jgi:putative tryptophan/tyrosine transport system substrate-binding protein
MNAATGGIRRREFITLVAVTLGAWQFAAYALEPRMPVIGFLSSRSIDADSQLVAAFHQGLAESGFVEGRNVTVEYRWAHGQYARLPTLAAELVSKPVAVLVSTGGTVSARAAKASTKNIPVVFTTADDPVKVGLVDSLSRPGGNITGITASFIESASKRIGLLRELLPNASTIAFLVNPTDPATATESTEVRDAVQAIGRQVKTLSASSEREIDGAFGILKEMRADALLIAVDPFFFARADQLVALAARQRIPTLYFRREFAVAGGLMAYGSNFAELFRIVGVYAGRILKGANPGDLPVQQPTKFELVINLKTAKALGLQIPPTLLARADEVIE